MLRFCSTVLGVVLGAGSLGCEYWPVEGDYRFIATVAGDPVFHDSCGLLQPDNSVLGARLRRAGALLMLSTDLAGIPVRGYYLNQSERFSLDGTGERLDLDVQGTDCIVDWVGIHIEGLSEQPSQFVGTIRIQYQTEASEACRCELEARYLAERELP